MEFIAGLLTAVVFFIAVYLAYRTGKNQTKKPNKVNALTEEEQRQREQIQRYNEYFKQLFQYDTDKALQRKKVM
jgi:amino acid permease